MARHHGVIGLNFYARFLKEGGEDYSTLDDMIRHLRHIMEVGGEDVIALGTDFDGITSGMELKDAGDCISWPGGCWNPDSPDSRWTSSPMPMQNGCSGYSGRRHAGRPTGPLNRTGEKFHGKHYTEKHSRKNHHLRTG